MVIQITAPNHTTYAAFPAFPPRVAPHHRAIAPRGHGNHTRDQRRDAAEPMDPFPSSSRRGLAPREFLRRRVRRAQVRVEGLIGAQRQRRRAEPRVIAAEVRVLVHVLVYGGMREQPTHGRERETRGVEDPVQPKPTGADGLERRGARGGRVGGRSRGIAPPKPRKAPTRPTRWS